MRRRRAALALVASSCGAAVVYAALRLGEAVLVPEPDPALVVWSEHAGYFWRAAAALYAGGMAGLVAWLASARDTTSLERLLVRAVPASAAILALQAAIAP